MSRSCSVLLSATAFWPFAASLSPAQDGIPNSSKTDVGEPFLRKKAEFDKFINGQETPTAKDYPLIDLGAKYYMYRLQWTANKDDPAALAKAIADFDRDVINPLLGANASKANQEARNQVGKAMAVRVKEVLDLDFVAFRPSVMHAGLTLPSLARLKQDDVGKLLTALAADKDKHDAIKLYAFKSMKEYFPAYQINDNDDPKNNKPMRDRKERELARIDALVKYIEAPRVVPSNQGELDAIRFVRREAIQALAHAEVPALSALKKPPLVEGAVAPTLLRVLIKKGIEPEASLSEKVEAAIGVCNLKIDNASTYQPEMGVFLVGRFLDEYIRTYAADFANFNKGLKPAPIAWRIQSERLRLALDNMVKNTQGTSAKAAAERIAQSGKDYMSLISGHKLLENPNAFRAIADAVRPKTNELFKGVKDAPRIDVSE